MFVPWLRVVPIWTQVPGGVTVTLLPPFQVTWAIRRSLSLTLAGTETAMLAAGALRPRGPGAAAKTRQGAVTEGVGGPRSSTGNPGLPPPPPRASVPSVP